MSKPGRPPKLDASHREALSAIVEANPTATLEEVGQEFVRRTGMKVNRKTLMKALEAAGWERSRDGSAVRVDVSEVSEKRDGYPDAHRRQDAEQTYTTCLTDAEWALVEEVRSDGRTGNTPAVCAAPARGRVRRCGAHRLRLAPAAEGLSALADCLPDLSPLEQAGDVRTDA